MKNKNLLKLIKGVEDKLPRCIDEFMARADYESLVIKAKKEFIKLLLKEFDNNKLISVENMEQILLKYGLSETMEVRNDATQVLEGRYDCPRFFPRACEARTASGGTGSRATGRRAGRSRRPYSPTYRGRGSPASAPRRARKDPSRSSRA